MAKMIKKEINQSGGKIPKSEKDKEELPDFSKYTEQDWNIFLAQNKDKIFQILTGIKSFKRYMRWNWDIYPYALKNGQVELRVTKRSFIMKLTRRHWLSNIRMKKNE